MKAAEQTAGFAARTRPESAYRSPQSLAKSGGSTMKTQKAEVPNETFKPSNFTSIDDVEPVEAQKQQPSALIKMTTNTQAIDMEKPYQIKENIYQRGLF